MTMGHRVGFWSISVIVLPFFDFRPALAVRVLLMRASVSVIVTFCRIFVHALSNSFMSECARTGIVIAIRFSSWYSVRFYVRAMRVSGLVL
mgnify:CR=1 FL=1